ncbi:MAG: hypothetical protein QM621_01980 [Aeromicrobium sp.]|uniref:hypothetical protein n=1 Tax=Aeromicrobium sp. TaxID=1871063 RepID=UPI0039E3931D
MTDWDSLTDAYGPATDIPDLLAAAARGEDVWDDLFGCLCHQGTVYPASYAALPSLGRLLLPPDAPERDWALLLAAAILASDNGPEDPAVVRERHADLISSMRDTAVRRLAFTADPIDFAYGLLNVMAFEDGGVWQRQLHCLADGEAALACPSCGAFLLLPLDPAPPRVIPHPDDGPACPVVPVTPVDDGSPEARLLRLASEHGQESIAELLPYLFGDAACPACSAAFSIPSALA